MPKNKTIKDITYADHKLTIKFPDIAEPFVIDFYKDNAYLSETGNRTVMQLSKTFGYVEIYSDFKQLDYRTFKNTTRYTLDKNLKPLLESLNFFKNPSNQICHQSMKVIDPKPIKELRLYFWDDSEDKVDLNYYENNYYKVYETAYYYRVTSKPRDDIFWNQSKHLVLKDFYKIQAYPDKENKSLQNYSVLVDSDADVAYWKDKLLKEALTYYQNLALDACLAVKGVSKLLNI